MTREEAINHIKDIICENNTVKHSDIVVFEEEKGALRMAIEALKEIEDIKEEFISQYPKNVYGDLELGGRSCVFSLNKVLEIIDKHVKEGDV